MPRHRTLLIALVALLPLTVATAHAQVAAAPDSEARVRLARLLLGLEYAMRDRPPAESLQAGISRTFDAASLAFFAGRNDVAGRTLDSLTAVIEPDRARRAVQSAAADSALARATADRLTVRAGVDVPYRLRVPKGASRPRALLIALHGAGGDERMWFEAYGAGMIVPLALARDLVVVSPLTTAMRDGPTLDALVEAVAASTPIDRRRVLLIGHSLGAITAWRLTASRATMLAGVACLAGPCGTVAPGDSTPRPPLFVAAGALDPLAPPSRLEAAVNAATAAGRSAEFRVIPDRGHTMMVPEVLSAALDWLVTRAPSVQAYRSTP